MSEQGDCWDNAVAESFFGSLKTERVFFSEYKTREAARRDITDYIEMFYNCRRRHSYLGNVSPRNLRKCRTCKRLLKKKCPFLLDHVIMRPNSLPNKRVDVTITKSSARVPYLGFYLRLPGCRKEENILLQYMHIKRPAPTLQES